MAFFELLFPPYVPFGSRNLSLGATGTDVAVVQAVYNLMLKEMNPPQGPMGAPLDAISGTFDAATRQAVINIQSYFGLAADGIVGPATLFAFGQGVGPNTTYGGPVYGSRTLRQGNSGGDVTVLQNRLNCFRYASIIGRPADGGFDAATGQAVFQFGLDAESNGDTGFTATTTAGPDVFDASWLYTFAGGRGIFTGRNGFDVVFVQRLLQELGIYRGRITGYYDAATRAAVIAFQSSAGIAADGVVGPATFFQFGRRNAVPAPSPLGIAWPTFFPPIIVPTPCGLYLAKTTAAAAHDIAGISLIESVGDAQWRVTVSAVNLPNPSVFGAFDSYTAKWTLTKEGVEEPIPLYATPAGVTPPVYSGAAVVTAGAPSVVEVFPLNTSTGSQGPAILSGNTFDCQKLIVNG